MSRLTLSKTLLGLPLALLLAASQHTFAAPSYTGSLPDEGFPNFSAGYYKCYEKTGNNYGCLTDEIKVQENRVSFLNGKMKKAAANFENPKKAMVNIDQSHKKWLELKDLQCSQYVRLYFEGGNSIGSGTTDLCNAMMIRDRAVLLQALLD